MTDVRRFDWNYSWTREALEGLDVSLKRLSETMCSSDLLRDWLAPALAA
jgi:hypothetical protein